MLSASEASRFSSAYEDEIPRRRLGMTLRQTPMREPRRARISRLKGRGSSQRGMRNAKTINVLTVRRQWHSSRPKVVGVRRKEAT
jgi:hypothetical protein